jgi:hypothetical protein
MGSHPLNLGIRFLLEITALVAVGMWGWKQSDSWLRILLAIGIPVILAVVWGIFNVPGDPSRSGEAPIVTPGIMRLLIELSIFAMATWAIYDLGHLKTSIILGVIVVLHYTVSYDRITWLLNH